MQSDFTLKIPENHCYENGILKYKNSWTGDIWKVVYFILIKHFDKIKHSYSLHSNYRGVMCIEIITFFQISLEEIENINNYSYEKDFKDYIKKKSEINNKLYKFYEKYIFRKLKLNGYMNRTDAFYLFFSLKKWIVILDFNFPHNFIAKRFFNGNSK